MLNGEKVGCFLFSSDLEASLEERPHMCTRWLLSVLRQLPVVVSASGLEEGGQKPFKNLESNRQETNITRAEDPVFELSSGRE